MITRSGGPRTGTDVSHRSTTRSERTDAITVLAVGAIAVVVVIMIVVLRAGQTFREGGIGWILPIDQQPIDATIGSGTGAVQGYATEALVIVPDVHAGIVATIVLSHVLFATTALLVIACTSWVAWSFLRGRFFAPGTARAFDLLGWGLAGGTALMALLDTVARRRVFAALGMEGAQLDGVGVARWSPVLAVAVAVGLLGRAFRRGTRLQKDTEGLV